jgi:hypothetical protein
MTYAYGTVEKALAAVFEADPAANALREIQEKENEAL